MRLPEVPWILVRTEIKEADHAHFPGKKTKRFSEVSPGRDKLKALPISFTVSNLIPEYRFQEDRRGQEKIFKITKRKLLILSFIGQIIRNT